jgi:uncharacterized protein
MERAGMKRLKTRWERVLRRLYLVATLILGASAVLSGQEMQIPHLNRYATDLSGTLTQEQLAALENKLQQFDRRTSTQLVVLVVPSLGNSSIEDASLRVAEANQIGRKGRDNGVLLFIAMQERRVRIEVGYGLEGALPDALSGLIIRREIGPLFRNSNYYAGINAGIDAIILATQNEYKASPEDRTATRGTTKWFGLIAVIFFILLRFAGRRRGRGLGGFWWWGGFPSGGGSGLGGGSFGSSGGGGSFGGFSGGGGSFGGGGASGSW